MKVILAGTRPPESIRKDPQKLARWYKRAMPFLCTAIELHPFIEIREVVSGRAPGIDTLGEHWAVMHGIPVAPFPARWKDEKWVFNPKAGFERNARMADYGEAAILLWDGKSRGTQNMRDPMQARGKPCYTHIYSALWGGYDNAL